MLRLELLLLLLVAVCFRIGDAHTRLVVGRHQQRHLVGQVMRHESLVFRVLSFDGFLHRTPLVKVGDSVGSGGHGAVYSVEIVEDNKVHNLHKRDHVVVKAGCSCPGVVDLVWEHGFHQRALSRCPTVTPKLYGPVVTLSEKDSKELKALKSCDEGCTQQLLFMEKMENSLSDVAVAKPLLQDKSKFLSEFVRPLLEGLKCYHDANIFHHDVKLGNILYRHSDNRVEFKFADFGVSMDLDTPPQPLYTGKQATIVSNHLPSPLPAIELTHGTPSLNPALSLDTNLVDENGKLVVKRDDNGEIIPAKDLRCHVDGAALALVIRSVYTQDKAVGESCFLSFRPCVRGSALSGGWDIRQKFLIYHKMTAAGVSFPDLEKVLDQLMTNDISISNAVKLIKQYELVLNLQSRQKKISAERH